MDMQKIAMLGQWVRIFNMVYLKVSEYDAID